MSSSPPTPPDEDPGPAFPGLKMSLGAPERAEPSRAYRSKDIDFASPRDARRWRRLALWLAVIIAAALIAWLLLG